MSDYAISDEAAGYEGPVQLEFVDPPTLNGEHVEWTYRTVGGRTAPPHTVVAQIVITSPEQVILGGGAHTLYTELGPHDVGRGSFSPERYTRNDGDYHVSITIGDDVRYVSYRIDDRQVYAA
jgi:hypothetical protein